MPPAKKDTNCKPGTQRSHQNWNPTSGAYPEHDSPCPSSHAPPVARDQTLIPTATFSTPLTYAQIASADLGPGLPPLVSTLETPAQAQTPTLTHFRSNHQQQPTQKLILKRTASKSATPTSPPKNAPHAPREILSNANSSVPWKHTKRPGQYPGDPALSSLAQWQRDEIEDERQNVVLREPIPSPTKTNNAPWKWQEPIEEMIRDEAIELDMQKRRLPHRRIIPAVPRLPFKMAQVKDKDCSTFPTLQDVKNFRSSPGLKDSYRPASPTLESVRKLRANEASKTSTLPFRAKQQLQPSRQRTKLVGGSLGSEVEEENDEVSDDLDIKQYTQKRLRAENKQDSQLSVCTKKQQSSARAIELVKVPPGSDVEVPIAACEEALGSKPTKELGSALRDISLFQGLSRPASKAEEQPSSQVNEQLVASQEQGDEKSISAYTSSSEGLVTFFAKPGDEDDAKSQKPNPYDEDFEFVEVPEDWKVDSAVNGKTKRGWGWLEGRK